MGELLATEVVFLPAGSVSEYSFRYQILGTLNFDTPFRGMDLGMIRSGIASLFRPAPEPPGFAQHPASEQLTSHTHEVLSSSTPTLLSYDISKANSTLSSSLSSISFSVYSLPISGPNYNPPFQNDIRRPIRTGYDKFIYFTTKYPGALRSATKEYFISHVGFGGCLGNFRGLKRRYARIRGLEDVPTASTKADPRVRFLNIYTTSTGRIDKKKHSRSSGTSLKLHHHVPSTSHHNPPSRPTWNTPQFQQITTLNPFATRSPVSKPSPLNGNSDPCWPRIFMEGVDDIGAHCGLFFPRKHYEGLLELVVGRLESWLWRIAKVVRVVMVYSRMLKCWNCKLVDRVVGEND
jgi:hypothetical protein